MLALLTKRPNDSVKLTCAKGSFFRLITLLSIVLATFVASDARASELKRPNILWITSEDNSIYWVGCYGSPNAKTPAIDQLAAEGFRYTHCFDNAAVCAPTRSTWITGMHAVSNGTQPMRSRNQIPHNKIKYYPDLLKQAGYHTSNPGKTDYNIGGREDKDCWEYKGGDGSFGWRQRKPGQPFFCVFNIFESHESRAHGITDEHGVLKNLTLNGLRNDTEKMKLFSYHPDLPVIRRNYAKYADAVEKMDRKVKLCIEELKKDGLYEDTIIVYNSDHGGVLPRSKRFLYSSGTHCPLIIRIPKKWKHLWPAEQPGATVDRLVSFVDMPKTWLSLAGANIPNTFQGSIFLGTDTEPEPKYHFSFRERADERYDSVRMIRDKQFAYIKNYMPYVPNGQYLHYLWRAPAAVAWEAHFRQGKTNDLTGRFFRPRDSEEFYDTVSDFDNVNNLINDSEHRKKIKELKQAMRQTQLEFYDSGLLPETMRDRRAEENNLTIYEMVRNKDLYPLEEYLDAADLSLERENQNLPEFVSSMSHRDAGIRYWAIVGLHLLGPDASAAEQTLREALSDKSDEIRMMAAWALVNIGQKEEGISCLREMLFEGCDCPQLLENVIDWIGESAFLLVKEHKYSKAGTIPNYRATILGHVADINEL